jgi:hypothetical protein
MWKYSVKSLTKIQGVLQWCTKEINGTQLVIEDWDICEPWDGFEIRKDGKVLEVLHVHCKVEHRIEAHHTELIRLSMR